jgi:predicted nucleotidyltransferase
MPDELLRKSILNTIAYFHLFKIPLTDREIQKNLFKPPFPATLADIRRVLNGELTGKLAEQEGFYFFRGADDFVRLRKERYLISDRKIKRSLSHIRILSKIPFIRAIFICNTLACQNAREESDVDLMIVCADGRIWFCRFFAAMLMKLLLKRPKENKTADKICLSFFLTESNLDLERFAYEEDIYLIYWLSQILPVYDPKNLTAAIYDANRWINGFLPNRLEQDICKRWRIEENSFLKRKLEAFFRGKFGNIAERVLKITQLRIMPERLKSLAKEDNTDVVLNDAILKFHDKDKRRYYRGRWKNLTRW